MLQSLHLHLSTPHASHFPSSASALCPLQLSTAGQIIARFNATLPDIRDLAEDQAQTMLVRLEAGDSLSEAKQHALQQPLQQPPPHQDNLMPWE